MTQPTTAARLVELRRLMVDASDMTEAQTMLWLSEYDDRLAAKVRADLSGRVENFDGQAPEDYEWASRINWEKGYEVALDEVLALLRDDKEAV